MDDMPIDTPESLAPSYARSDYKYRALMVIDAADRDAANAVAATLDEASGPDTFSVGLSPTGLSPVTHYWCSVAVTEEQWLQLLMMREQMFTTAVVTEWYDVDRGKPQRLLDELGLQRVAVEVMN